MLSLHTLKRAVEKLPEPVGKLASWVPFSWRLGAQYREQRRQIIWCGGLRASERRQWLFERAKDIAGWAGDNHPFYRKFYEAHGCRPSDIVDFKGFEQIPIVTKSDLQRCPLEQRSTSQSGRYLTNTGGSSGQPLVFYLDSKAFAREWAHMHFIWERLDYRRTDLKLVFRGKRLGNRPLVYNPVHNEYTVNAYCSYERIAEALWAKMRKNRIRFLHGYPSAIYDFIRYCLEQRSDIVEELSRSLKGILYASEYPAPMYRDPVEAALGVKSLSWYGHSEFSALAYEVEKYLYAPLPTYGYVEAVPSAEGHRLVCTGYHNRVCPFVRYDTGDLIEPVEQDEILHTFRISAGRIGDFVVDGQGKRVSLTALIFGRHHAVFDRVRFLQISQPSPGRAVIILTRQDHNELREESALALMDLKGVDINFTLVIVDEPFRTPAGKVILKVPHEQLELNPGQRMIRRDETREARTAEPRMRSTSNAQR